MKKLFLITLMLVMLCGLIFGGCAKPAPVPAPAPAPTPTPAPAPAPAPAPVPAPEKPLKLKFSDPTPPTGTTARELIPAWIKEIQEFSKGRVEVTLYSGGALGTHAQQYDLLLSCAADIASIDPGATPGVFPRADIVKLPISCKSSETGSMVFWELMKKYMMDTEFKDVKVIWVNTYGAWQLFARTKEVKTLEDFKGMRLGALSPRGVETVKSLGAVPVFILFADMYTALDRGLIDGIRIASKETVTEKGLVAS